MSIKDLKYYQNGYLPFTEGRTLLPVSYGHQLPQSAAYMPNQLITGQSQLIAGQNQLLSGPMSPPCPCLSGVKPTQVHSEALSLNIKTFDSVIHL